MKLDRWFFARALLLAVLPFVPLIMIGLAK
jgi:hypothetical protein